MSRKYKFLDPQGIYFVSFATVNWIEVFTRNVYRDILVDSLKYCQEEKGLILYAWCIMPNHVHLIIGTMDKKLQDIMRDFKAFTSRKLREEIEVCPEESRKEWMLWMFKRAGLKNGRNQDWQLWQQNNHPIEIYTSKVISQKLEYLHNNPVKAGYIDNAENWLYSSARNYSGRKGLIDVEFCL